MASKRAAASGVASSAEPGPKQQKLFMGHKAVKVEGADGAGKTLQVNVQRISEVAMAKDVILKHHVFADVMTAMPLDIKDGGHKAGSADVVGFSFLRSSDNTPASSTVVDVHDC